MAKTKKGKQVRRGVSSLKNGFRKYGNKWTVYNGVKYHSKLESQYAELLDSFRRRKLIKGWQRQQRVDCCVNGRLVCFLLVDFLVLHNDNHFEYLEVKGQETDVYKLKYKLLMALYPSITYIVAKQKHYKRLMEGETWKKVFFSKE